PASADRANSQSPKDQSLNAKSLKAMLLKSRPHQHPSARGADVTPGAAAAEVAPPAPIAAPIATATAKVLLLRTPMCPPHRRKTPFVPRTSDLSKSKRAGTQHWGPRCGASRRSIAGG